ncbi:MAG: hypothetical protein R3E82_07130 [Pseudomonadales bacterium]
MTLDAEFDTGTLNGVNHDAPNNDQLQLNTTGSTFPVLWVANAGEDTVSRIDTDADCEVARYETWFSSGIHGAWNGPAPSRTAVDGEGNVFVANRHFDNRPVSVLKILSEGGIDRNGNGVIDTSADANGDCQITPDEMIPLVDGNANGILEDAELADERVAWVEQIPNTTGQLGRSLCIAGDGNLWAGTYNGHAYYELNPDNGSVLTGPIATPGLNPYGCVVDGDGILYSAGLSNVMGVLDTNTNTFLGALNAGSFFYGITAGNGKIYGGSSSNLSYLQFDPNVGVGEPDGNPATGTFSTPASVSLYSLGVGIDGNGQITVGQGSSLTKFDRDTGAVVWTTTSGSYGDVRGIVTDSNNNTWAISRDRNAVYKFDGATGNLLTTVPVGNEPYTYSDATGFAFRNTTDPFGVFTVIIDGAAGAVWDSVSWNTEPEGSIPTGASIVVEARVADSLAGLGGATYAPATNGMTGLALAGQFIQIRSTLRPNSAGESPVLSNLLAITVEEGEPMACDADNNGQIDRNDIALISAARGQSALPGDPRDLDGNGIITVNDARGCALQCTNARCAP